jgi:hypothetical protein
MSMTQKKPKIGIKWDFGISDPNSFNYTVVENLDPKTQTKIKQYYIEGIGLMGDIINRNNRMYPCSVLDETVAEYYREFINPGRPCGELNHPKAGADGSITSIVDLANASHKVESIIRKDTNYWVKSRILNTKAGKDVKDLIDEDIKLSYSTRGMISVDPEQVERDGYFRVNRLFMTAIDIVHYPSAPETMVNAVVESPDWLYLPDITKVTPQDQEVFFKHLSTNGVNKAQLVTDAFVAFVDSMRVPTK